jgi:hypothetical protein
MFSATHLFCVYGRANANVYERATYVYERATYVYERATYVYERANANAYA